MIWAIGDIHGMLDPLKRLITSIRAYENICGAKVEKVIFLGNYLGYGPSSLEVIDYVAKMDYEKICLMGNHEDYVMRELFNDVNYLDSLRNELFFEDDEDLYEAFYNDSYKSYMLKGLNDKIKINYSAISDFKERAYKDGKLIDKYKRFIRPLKYYHEEIFKVGKEDIKFFFSHSLPDPNYPLAKQQFKNYRAFNNFLSREARQELTAKATQDPPKSYEDIYLSLLANSIAYGSIYSKNFDTSGKILVHGHIPSFIYDKSNFINFTENKVYDRQFNRFDPTLNLPFILSDCHYSSYNRLIARSDPGVDEKYQYLCPSFNDFKAVNIDTGAVYGGALTALGLSSQELAKGRLLLITVPTDRSQRQPKDKFSVRAITINPV
jgi:hypothetical protein